MEVYKRDENGDPIQYRATAYLSPEDAEYVREKANGSATDAETIRRIVREHQQYAEEDN